MEPLIASGETVFGDILTPSILAKAFFMEL